ncbi:hypothetical protein KDW_46110 [Dictyobacter vulcani]|uniref:Glycosyltransferase RgtA/B/C/D-like domain-containing protein n=1 Tax=Dictyobacter vulcani TaxID=2607529 RepID=A0A5J4KWE4_9CHLR|nr:glycosyltransferase family 39 protein [Dictyobacter vulcani]GER90449.1 hypothetical protein KDW_46110 [Dictyobacter vulcani]
MAASIESTTKKQTATPDAAKTSRRATLLLLSSQHLITVLVSIGLALVALLPRLLLARQLDEVTDEIVYISGGKLYLSLIASHDITSGQWLVNHEHPPLVKILIGTSIVLNNLIGHPLGELMAGRLPSVIMGTLLVLGIYWLGRAPFGKKIAQIAALALAVSPWLAYFSALAYLDMTMATFVTLAYLLLWHAIKRPWLYPVVTLLIGLGAASKYPAALAIPAIVLFIAYYYFVLRPKLPIEQRPAFPWRWWAIAFIVAPLGFLLADPAIWPQPVARLLSSFAFEATHSKSGHLVFLDNHILTHVPIWTSDYTIFIKMSSFLTIPAVFFCIFALVKVIRFHLNPSQIEVTQISRHAYLLIWLIGTLAMFSLLNIAVGTHYYLPVTPPVAIAGVAGLAVLLHYLTNLIWKKSIHSLDIPTPASDQDPHIGSKNPGMQLHILIPAILLAILAIAPHLLGLSTVYAAEGYTSELFQNNENQRLQVAYPGYREALQWLASHSQDHARVGLIGSSLNGGGLSVNWFTYNPTLNQRFQLKQIDVTDKDFKYIPSSFQGYTYLIWPTNLKQRGYPWPAGYHHIYSITGGQTIYCDILTT